MKMDHWVLIAKSLSGELTPEEGKLLENWMAGDIRNQALYNDAKKIWDATGVLPGEFVPDTEHAWEKMQRRMEGPKVITLRPNRTNWLQIAASVFLVLTFSVLVKYILNDQRPAGKGSAGVIAVNNNIDSFETTRWDSATFFYLPDRTRVALNKGSKIAYPIQFLDSVRMVTLTGEAFFDVHHDSSWPFIIKAGNSEIRVLGTSFNVRAYAREGKVEVTVITGKVRFTTTDSTGTRSVILTPDQHATFTRKSGEVKTDTEKPRGKFYQWWKNAQEDVERDVNKLIQKKNKSAKQKDSK